MRSISRRLTICAISALSLLAACGPLANARADRIDARFPPQGQFLQVGRAVIHAEVSGQGPDLILIHGASGNTRDMAALAARLSDRYRVIRFDRPGLGYSTAPDATFNSPLIQADYLRAASQQLGVTHPIVLGHSYGGAVAMAWALEAPETRAVVLLSAAVLPWEGGLSDLYTAAATPVGEATLEPLASAFLPDWALDRIVTDLFKPQTPPVGYANEIGAALAIRPDTLRNNLRQLKRLKPHLYLMAPKYQDLTLPIEMVHGVDDPVVSYKVQAVPMAQNLPNVHLTSLPGIGHMGHHVAQDAVIAAIDRAAARSD
ncbi:alpha/beta fold hydrolase [Falsirhodobacter halotolerans]|uniref:alpha/beta fold hydrolase n=1 Tax=Falsirhodobacter halotolerans TaxID=1146892 RepID=UPI001FD3D7B1|nr:alpha/beta hydrolase [Falsirhodobacter halotolerans]MCJ8139425.1 alpha/beta hydrolase [Falsirhodobacter halotolerans]